MRLVREVKIPLSFFCRSGALVALAGAVGEMTPVKPGKSFLRCVDIVNADELPRSAAQTPGSIRQSFQTK